MRTITLLAGAGLATAHARSRGRTHRVADQIEGLGAVEDARTIAWLLGTREFPWDAEQSLSLALFRTFAVPEISSVLAGSGAFLDDAQRRYDDTELIIALMGRDGLTEGSGRTALGRMNAMHAAFDIDHDLLTYVLSTFIVEPLRWLARYGWRQTTAKEQEASVLWYCEMGRHMGLRDLPTSIEDWMRYSEDYERAHFRFHPDNRIVAEATIQMFLDAKLPSFAHGPARLAILAMLNEPHLLAAFGYDPAPRPVVHAVRVGLRARALFQRHLMPERRTAHDPTLIKRITYPHGHVAELLGTFPNDEARARVAAHRATVPPRQY